MALLSPGTEVSIINESQYTSAAQNTIPYLLLATAKDKLDPSGTAIAEGTTDANADNIWLITSQRELVNTFGEPTFYKTTGGTAIHNHQLNEYGLMAAYSLLGITNRVYIQRVDIDMAELEAALGRPSGDPNNGTYWFDLTESEFGVFEWNSVTNTFNLESPLIITDDADLVAPGGAPLASIGTIDSYAVVTTNTSNPIYYKNASNNWVLIGTDSWMSSHATVIGTVSNPTLTISDQLDINGTTVTLTGTTVTTLASDINLAAITGVTAGVDNNRLAIYIDSTANAGAGTLVLANGGVGDVLGDVGITAGTYNAPAFLFDTHINVPRWRSTDTTPRPSGSVWLKTTAVNNGASIIVKKWDSSQSLWIEQTAPLYLNDQTANKYLDPLGGENIAAGATYVQYDVSEDNTATMQILTRTPGDTVVTGATANPTFTASDQFTIQVSQANSDTLTAATTITLSGTTAADFVADVQAAGVSNLEIFLTTAGYIQFKHNLGGVVVLKDTTGTPIATAGITTSLEHVRLNAASDLVLSNWDLLSYSADLISPGQDPLDGTKWYFSAVDEVDIMIKDGGAWKGYQGVTNDVRGMDLSTTSPAGPIVSATEPTEQSDSTALVYGDLWVDTSDISMYPVLKRWESVNSVDQWVTIDNTDQTTSNGILFADARWGINDSTDPITDDIPLITDLLTSDYLDVDAPDAALYPEGMLLWNLRRSGYNVKEFRVNYFNADDFSGVVLPTETNAWVTVSGLRDDGSAYMGAEAQRNIIVAAMKSAIDTNYDIREEQRLFNLIAAPGYPELIPNMVALNNERSNTAFVVGDTPIDLANTTTALIDWATNANGDGLVTADEYLGVFYPSGQTNDLDGTTVVVPPSHMMLRTIINSDEKSYPWLAPAGVRRGQVDNAVALGYVNSQTGEFVSMSTRQGVRDTLYQNNINPIMFEPGVGILNFGNKTTEPNSALDRINVSRLAAYLRREVDKIGKLFLFEPNDKITRDEFKGKIEQLLNDLVAKRAIGAYLVVVDDSNNTPERIDRNELWADIAIEPVKASEFIYIPIRLKNTGEIASGV